MRLLACMIVGAILIVPHVSGDQPAPPRKAEDGISVSKWPYAIGAGKWKVLFANGVTEVCEIREDATVSVVEPLRRSTGKLQAKSGSVVMVFADDRVERWTPVGRRYVVEHWFPAAQVPVTTPIFGIAELAQ